MVKATKKPSSGGGKKKGSSIGSKKKKSSMPSSPSAAAADATAAATDADASLRAPDTPSLGMRTSSIANKLVRKEQYAKLKHKQKASKMRVERE